MDWREYLTPFERLQLADIQEARQEGQALRRKIYDRCRKRMPKGMEDGRV